MRLAPPYELREIEAFEMRIGTTLPDNLRQYLTQVSREFISSDYVHTFDLNEEYLGDLSDNIFEQVDDEVVAMGRPAVNPCLSYGFVALVKERILNSKFYVTLFMSIRGKFRGTFWSFNPVCDQYLDKKGDYFQFLKTKVEDTSLTRFFKESYP